MTLTDLYRRRCAEPSDLQGHLHTLVRSVRATNAQTVVELGVRSGVSTVAFLHALQATGGRLWSCDAAAPDVPREVTEAPHWTLVVADDLAAAPRAPRPVDVLFIDTVHTYAHTLAELQAYVPLVRRGGCVLAHDTESHPEVARALDVYFGPDGWEHHTGSFGLGVAAIPGGPGRPAAPRHDQALVSCFYDLQKREQNGRRAVDFYYRHARMVLELELPLVVYADPELADWVQSFRETRSLTGLTRVVRRPLESLPMYAAVPAIASFPTIANGDPLKATPLHQVVEWSKLDLLEEVMADDPFDSDHFAWIDLGLGHVADAPAIFPAPSERVAVLQMRAVAPREVEDRLAFVRYERGRIAAGFFRGGRDALRQLIGEFRGQLASLLVLRFRPNEQMVLGILTATRPDLFDFYYGDYPSLLTNWDHVRRDVAAVLDNASHCRVLELWDRAHDICERLRSSVQAVGLQMTETERARLEDEDDIVTWTLRRRALLSAAFRVDKPPLVSVIIPVYNGEATLERAVRSVLGQTFSDLEVVVIDDASSDGSVALARRLARADGRVRVVTRGHRAGSPATPRDDGVALSTGAYLALLDQDDYWLPDKLAAQMPLFQSGEVALVYSDAYFVSEGQGLEAAATAALTTRGGRLPEGDVSAELVREDFVPALTAVIRREWLTRVGRFDRHDLVGVDDYYTWLRISLTGGRFAAVQRPLAVHCQRHESLGSTRQLECAESLRRMWAALGHEFPDHTLVACTEARPTDGLR